MALKMNYIDDVLDTIANEKRVYNIVDSDGNVVMRSVSLEDITVYLQQGDSFGASDINATNKAIADFISGTLSAGETTITLTDERITENSVIDIYVNVYGIAPTAVNVTPGEMTLIFDVQEKDIQVKVRCL